MRLSREPAPGTPSLFISPTKGANGGRLDAHTIVAAGDGRLLDRRMDLLLRDFLPTVLA
jgi:hypothetical protein